jgi:xanthine dehydrogenase accessory factor
LVNAEGVPVLDWSRTMVLTPGGGRVGGLLGEAFDGRVADAAGRGDLGRLVTFELTAVDADFMGLPGPGRVSCLIVPAAQLPADLWPLADARAPIRLSVSMTDDEVTHIDLEATGSGAHQEGSVIEDGRVISNFHATPQMVVVGDTPVARALTQIAVALGWTTRVMDEPSAAGGAIAALSTIDKVVVTAHDLELAGSALLAALDSEVGYIGSLGSHQMQQNRADWLAYRGVTELDRVHGPAGIDIGADTPAEIAVAIVAEAIAVASRAVVPRHDK